MPVKQKQWWLVVPSLLAFVFAGVAVWLVLPSASHPSAGLVAPPVTDIDAQKDLGNSRDETAVKESVRKPSIGLDVDVEVARLAVDGTEALSADSQNDRVKVAVPDAPTSLEKSPSWAEDTTRGTRQRTHASTFSGALVQRQQRELSPPNDTTGLSGGLGPNSSAIVVPESTPAPIPTIDPAIEEPVVPDTDPLIHPQEGRAARFVAHFPIGNSSTNEARHRVGWNLPAEGWAGFVDERVMPQVDAGVRRIMLHNPFGHRAGVVMQFDQFLEAQEAGLTWLTQGFAEAWEPLTNAGIEVIAYVGSPAHDERSQAFEAVGDVAGFDAYARRCLQPLLDAGVSIAFDSAAIEPADTYTFRIAQWTRNRGVRTYIEPRPRAYLPHWFDYGIVTIYPFWLRTDPSRFPEIADRHAANEDLTGEVIVIHNRPPESHSWEDVSQWMLSDINDIYDRKLAPAVPFTYWLRWGGDDLDSLIRRRPAAAFD